MTDRTALGRGWWGKDGIDRVLADPARHGRRVYALLMLELTLRIHGGGARAVPTGGVEDFADG